MSTGTLFGVRLKDSLIGSKSHVGQAFEAVLDTPVVENGSILLPAGTVLTGHMECAQAPELRPGKALVCLTLNAIHLEGRSIPIQTSSLFARPETSPEGGARLRKGHRLTFRLSRDLVLPASTPVPPTGTERGTH